MTDPGYEIVPDLLSNRECGNLISALSEDHIAKTRAGARHLMATPSVAALANDPRLVEIARRWLGRDAIPFRATLFDKSSTANWLIPWHQDTALPLAKKFDHPEWGPWSEKSGTPYAHAPAWALSRVVALRVHPDPSNSDNGPLRILPTSHSSGIMSDSDVDKCASTTKSVECTVASGGVIVMRPLLVHASSKAVSEMPRRVGTTSNMPTRSILRMASDWL